MVKYCCERCGKEFSQKSHHDSHKKRKIPCENNVDKIKLMVNKAVEDKLKELDNNETIEQHDEVTFVDLFCGIGAFHYSFEKLGFKCVMASDIYKPAKENYKENYGIDVLDDICEIDPSTIENYDILCAGFPCFVQGTKVLTYTGYKNIEDVLLTDTLMTHTGQFQKILNLQHKNYNGSLYNITAKYHQSFKCTDEHPFYIREKTRKWNNGLRKYEYIFKNPEWKKAHELDKNHYFGMKINENSIIPDFSFDKIINQHKTDIVKIKLDNPDMWFMMGYFIGNGCCVETEREHSVMKRICFCINEKHVEEILNISENCLPLKFSHYSCKSGKASVYITYDKVWFNIFKQFGKYAHGKLIPEWVQDAPTEYIQEFINGYHKADGCITKNDCYEFTTVSHNLAFGLQRLYLKLGHLFGIRKDIRPKTTVIEGRTVNQRDTYHIRGYVRENKRKYSSFIENGYVWYAPSKIEKADVENESVYNFEVENDNSYIIENIISHNCQSFSQAGFHKGFNDSRGTMFSQVMRFVKQNIPKIVILENVRALLNHDKGKSFLKIKTDLENEGYTVIYHVLKCSDYGIPQMRKRLFIIGFKNIATNNLDQFFNLQQYEQTTTLTKYLGQNFKKDTAYTLRCGGKHSPIDDRHNWDGYWVDDKEYRLTIDDGLKLQGFHDYNFIGKKTDKWKMLGNTIPTIFTEIIGKQIIKHCPQFSPTL